MRFVPTRVHGVADWLMGALLVALPWLLRLDRGSPEGFIPLALGLTEIVAAFVTKFYPADRTPGAAHAGV